MVVIGLVLLFKLPLATKRYDVILHRQLEIFSTHSRQFRLKDDMILVLVDVHTRIPGASADALLPEASRKVRREKAIYLLLKAAQVTEWVIPNDTHFEFSSL